MKRREFLRKSLSVANGLGAAALTTAAPAQASGPTAAKPGERLNVKPARMVAGHQHDHSEKTLRALAAFGITHICSGLPSPVMDDNWSVDGLTRFRKRIESFGVQLDMVPLPMSSVAIEKQEDPNILLGKSPARDREIEQMIQMIRSAGKAGIPAVKYNLTMLGVVRTGTIEGRGGAKYSTFVYDQAKQTPLTLAGEVGEDEYWERITYFLKRVVPAAEEAKVRICCHPNDPGLARGKAFRGIHSAIDNVEGLKRFVQTVPSAYHGLNFCQGTISEMLDDPGKEIFDVIRWFGMRGKIFNVHFRNIQGGYLHFSECFPDNGAVNMPRALRTYKEIGYEGMIMPDHVPIIEGDTGGAQAFAFCWGYIQALLQEAGEKV